MFQSLTQPGSPLLRIAAVLKVGMRWVPAVLFVVAVPVFLITGSLTWAFNNIGLYESGFEKYHISRASGISSTDLRQVALDLRGYFNSGEEPLHVVTRIYGQERELFNEKEVHHMRDVKRLLWGVYGAFAVSAVCLAALVAAGFARERGGYQRTLSRRALWGGGLTMALLVLFGIIASVGFDALFLLFHRVSFANDFWQLDPRTDYLVLLFPQGFWFDATMWVALRAIAGGLLLAAAECGRGAPRKLQRQWRGIDGTHVRQPDGPLQD